MTLAGTAKGAIQLGLYIKLFNKLDPTGGWHVGNSANYVYNKGIIALGSPPCVVVVAPPVFGMIYYEPFTPQQLGKAAVKVRVSADNARLQQMMGIATLVSLLGGF